MDHYNYETTKNSRNKENSRTCRTLVYFLNTKIYEHAGISVSRSCRQTTVVKCFVLHNSVHMYRDTTLQLKNAQGEVDTIKLCLVLRTHWHFLDRKTSKQHGQNSMNLNSIDDWTNASKHE